jgi:uncharacterized DUF497 family protein
MGYELDDSKRHANILKHGLDFAAAVKIFGGWFTETEDQRRDYGESRYRGPETAPLNRAFGCSPRPPLLF